MEHGFQHQTTDHQEIRSWALKHNAKPAVIEVEGLPNEKKGIRLDFPGTQDESMLTDSRQSEDVSWDEFFQVFDSEGLAFLYNDQIDDPTQSYKFIPLKTS